MATQKVRPDEPTDAPKATPRARRRLALNALSGALVGLGVLAGVIAGVRAIQTAPVPADPPTRTPSVWSPVREGGTVPVRGGFTWPDPHDTPADWVDVTRVDFYTFISSGGLQPNWSIELAAPPPPAASREHGLLIAYGLVLDTTGDRVADYVVGIDNDAPERGDLHAWFTDLATGETDEQIGPPYGVPVEFSHPDELGSGSNMHFTFLPGTGPADLTPGTVRFYAWSSATRGGEVFAWDYAPDEGWMTSAPEGTWDRWHSRRAEGKSSWRGVCENPGWPSTGGSPPGVYSWDGPGPGGDGTHREGFMHNGYGSGDVEITLGSVPEGAIPGDGTTVTIAGHDGHYRRIDTQREEWIVEIEGTTIAIHLTAHPGASQSGLADGHAIIGSMRTDPCDNEIGFELVFTLTNDEWDSG